MARPNPIRSLMEAELPGITYQRRKLFRPSMYDALYAYKIINRYVFDNQLRRPEIILGQAYKYWGYCQWNHELQSSGSYCTIKLSNKWFCQQWFLNTLAHEMVHQYQWDIYRWKHIDEYGTLPYNNSGGHGPTFFEWRDCFANFGLTLKTSFGQKRWFRHQNFNKC
jgi:hypothetical protein